MIIRLPFAFLIREHPVSHSCCPFAFHRVRCKLQDGSLRIGGQDLRIWEQAELASIVYPELQRLFGEEDWGILDFVRDLHSGTAKGAPT